MGNIQIFSKDISSSFLSGSLDQNVGAHGIITSVPVASNLSDMVLPEVASVVDSNNDGIPDSYHPSVDSDGNYVFSNAYGYVFNVDDVNGVIDGEDSTIITTTSAYNVCNPIWSVSVHLRPDGDNYKVVNTVSSPGSVNAAGITLQDGDIILVVHSAASYPGYDNWMDRVAAAALKPGDLVSVSEDYSSVTALSSAAPGLTGHDYYTTMSTQWVDYMSGILSNVGGSDYVSYCLRDYSEDGSSFLDHYVLIYDLDVEDDIVTPGVYPFIDISRAEDSFYYEVLEGTTSSVAVPDIGYGSFGSLSDFKKGGGALETEALLFAFCVFFVFIIIRDIFEFVLSLGKK